MNNQNQLAFWEQKLVQIKGNIGKRATLIKWGLALAVFAFIGPAILMGAITGVMGIAAALLFLGMVHWFPVIALKISNSAAQAKIVEANRHIAALKAEAAKNPIETLLNEQVQKHEELKREADLIGEFDREVTNLKDTLDSEGTRIRSEAGKRKGTEVLRAMELKLAYRRTAYKQAQEKLAVYDAKVDEAAALWRVALAAQRADAASGENNQDMFRKIMEETAFHSVASEVNMAMAGLRTSIMKETVTEADLFRLENNPSEILEVSKITVKQGVDV